MRMHAYVHTHIHTCKLTTCSYNHDTVTQAWEDLPIIAQQ